MWDVEDKGKSVVLTMNSNPAGVMNDGFFADLNSAFSGVRELHPSKPVVLSSGAKMFSPGLDLEHCIPIFKKGGNGINLWFERFLNAMLTVFEHPAPTVAAIGGHAIAGGCILALCCDMRIMETGKALTGLNETSIGFPMPDSLDVLVVGVAGRGPGRKMIDAGKLYPAREAFELGIVHKISEPGAAVPSAVSEAELMDSFSDKKKAVKENLSAKVRKAFAETDSQTLAAKLSYPRTVEKLEEILETVKKGGR